MLVLQVVVVNWWPAQAVFDTVALTLSDWALATGTAASVWVLEELRKLAVRCWRRVGTSQGGQRVGAD